MKRIGLLLVCLNLTIGLLSAQVKNYVSLWGNVGESSLLTTLTDVSAKSSFGAGGGVGAGYEMHVSSFVWTVGLQANLAHSSFRLGDISSSFRATDDEGDAFTYTYTQNARRDCYTDLSLRLPVMVGADFGRMYFLAGLKLDMSLLGRSKVRTRLSSSGDYDDLIDPFTGMEEHGFFDDMTFNQKGKFAFKPDVMVSAEVGVNLGTVTKETGYDVPRSKQKYRIALFFDYGLLDRHERGKLESITLPSSFNSSDMTSGITVNDILSTTQSQQKVHNLLVGVKFTVLFKLRDPSKCVICEYDPPLRW